jgi:phosphate transport system ATP-binding protein
MLKSPLMNEREADAASAEFAAEMSAPRPDVPVEPREAVVERDRRVKIGAQGLTLAYGDAVAVREVSIEIPERSIVAFIGPSGCGKSSLLRCFNRMNDTIRSARISGQVTLDGVNIYDPRVDVVELRKRVGMVFQKPNPFPMSVSDNVASGPRLHGARPAALPDIVEDALRRAALWDEVKDKLRHSALELSGGQQQRLCIARALAMNPDVLLLDEPCSALDPISTALIEELMQSLRARVTMVLVTHNMFQASRVSDRTAFMLAGELIEVGPTPEVFTNPQDARTEGYITGRFG